MMDPIPDFGPSQSVSFTAERRPSNAHVLSPTDHDLYSRAFDAADRGDWTAARALADQGHDDIARRLVQWRYLLDKNSGASFGEIDAFLKANPDWPSRDALFARAEQAMDPAMSPSSIIAWFGDRPPATGIGQIRLGEAMIAVGRTSAGRDLVRQAWAENSFDPPQELAIVQKDGGLLTTDIDEKRLDNLLWRDDLAGARRELSRVGADAQRLAQARLAVRTSPAIAQRLIADLSADQASDPGLLFDRARAARRAGDDNTAEQLFARMRMRAAAQRYPAKLWGELNLLTRQMLLDGNYRAAYSLVSDTGLTSANEFAEAEFMAGWIALRYLKDPKTALAHFQKLAAGVSRPISVARAHYWAGRASEAAGDVAQAWHEYRLASRAPETFYGQIALARIDPTPVLHLSDTDVDSPLARADLENLELGRAIAVLADLGIENYLRAFAQRYQELHGDARHLKLLCQSLTDMGFREVAVRLAKTASYGGLQMLAYNYPVIAIPGYRGPGAAPETATVLGLIRQETEFDPYAVSNAGARGIMQLMPASARKAATEAGIAYRPNDLLSDTDYNMQLGMTEFSGGLSDWNGSLILASAAYNAGTNNVRKWLNLYGDPRSPTVDPIDWIEQIPFSETRNYVQRVLENTQIYRNRLAGRDQPLRVLIDLYRPSTPAVSVLNYIPPASQKADASAPAEPNPEASLNAN